MVRGTNILDIAFAHQFGNPGVNREQYAQIVVKMAHFIHEMHRRRWIMGDICAENLYLSDDTGQVHISICFMSFNHRYIYLLGFKGNLGYFLTFCIYLAI